MPSKAATVPDYLAELPDDRRAAISAVRDLILKNLPKGYHECMQYGMIGYCVPHSIYPAGYHCDPRQPLPFAGLASNKSGMSLYLHGLYVTSGTTALLDWFHKAWAATGKRLDMGKACLRFKKVDDLALDVLAELFRRLPVKAYIEHYEAALAAQRSGRPAAKPAAKTTRNKSPKTSARKPTKPAARAKKVSNKQ
jgi:hypothetical protein